MPQHRCECGRPILIHVHPGRNPKSAARAPRRAIKNHDLCRQCNRALMMRALNLQREAVGA